MKFIEGGREGIMSNLAHIENHNIFVQVKEFVLKSLMDGFDKVATLQKTVENFEEVEYSVLEELVNECYTKLDEVGPFKKASPTEQLIFFMRVFYPQLIRNELSLKIEINGRELTETEINSFIIHAKIFGVKRVSKETIIIYLNSTYTPSYHPIKRFFEKHKYEKFKGIIEKLAESLNSDSGMSQDNFHPDFVSYFLKKWMVGVVAMVYGKKNNLMLILSGKQNTGKTSFFTKLLPTELQRFFSESELDQDNDADKAMILCESLLVFDDELGGKNKKQWTLIKKLLDRIIWTIRRPYGRGMEKVTRIASFCGTTNSLELLGDDTGNRRYIIFLINKVINFELYNSIDKTKIWMEAYHLFKSGYNHELTREDIDLLNACTEEFQIPDLITESINQCLRPPTTDDPEHIIEEMNPSQIVQYLKQQTLNTFHVISLGNKLHNLGFTMKIKKVNKTTQRIYRLVLKSESASQLM